MQNIVHLCLIGSVTDGLSYQDNLLPKYHHRLGYDVTIITHHYVLDDSGREVRDERKSYVNDDGVRILRLEAFPRSRGLIGRTFLRYPALFNTLQYLDPDILFVHGCQFMDVCTIVRFKKDRPKLRIYVDNHADFFNSATNWLSKNVLHGVIWRHYAQMIEPYTRKFYGVLPDRVDFLINMYGIPRNKVELLVMGADDDEVERAGKLEVRVATRAKYGIDEDDFLIVTGGKIDVVKKQVLLLIEAVHQITNEKIKLVLFGSIVPELKAEVLALVDGKRIQYAGWLSAYESFDCFSAADIVVFPCGHSVYWEQVVGQGIPMVVKWWAGKTHVDLGGNVEFLHTDTCEEIREKIEMVFNNPQKRKTMQAVAKSKGMAFFSYKSIARRSIENNG